MTKAYWAKGSQVHPVDGDYHLDFIHAHPELFDLTEASLEDMSDEEILKAAFASGWVRARYYQEGGESFWDIEMFSWVRSEKTMYKFFDWALFDSQEMKEDDALFIFGVDDGYRKSLSRAISVFSLFEKVSYDMKMRFIPSSFWKRR